jgi:hypothetical protein
MSDALITYFVTFEISTIAKKCTVVFGIRQSTAYCVMKFEAKRSPESNPVPGFTVP